MAMKGISGDAHFFEDTISLEKIRKLLDNKTGTAGMSEKLEAMKSLLVMISKGLDVSELFADVVKNVIVSSVEVKKLVYMYLVHYADADAQCRELALLSINSFQRDLADPNQLIRALALRVMTSIRVPDIIQIQLIAIRRCTEDESPYVRKTAANATSKVYALDQSPEQVEVLCEIIAKLLDDNSTMVLGSAVQAFSEVCPHRLDLLHKKFRNLCYLLGDIDEWGQIVTINVLMRYAREQFLKPPRSGDGQDSVSAQSAKELFSKKSKGVFYSDEEGSGEEVDDRAVSPFHIGSAQSTPLHGSTLMSTGLTTSVAGGEELDPDHRLLLRNSLPLLKSRNSAVVLAVSSLHFYCGTQSMATSALLGKSLVRIIRNQREIQYVVLSAIASMATEHPQMFAPFLNDFFIRATDPAHARILKLNILSTLASPETSAVILNEFSAYVKHTDNSFVAATVRAVGRVAVAVPSVADQCLRGLMQLVASSDSRVVAESVVVVRQLLQRNPNHECVQELFCQLAALLSRVTAPEARASIVWILGEFREVEPSLLPDCLRLLAKGFADELPEVKMQILNLAVKLILWDQESRPLKLLSQYVFELSKFDMDYDIRDRSRFLRVLLSSSDTGISAHKVLLSPKPPPFVGAAQPDTLSSFTIGSLSDMVKHQVYGYICLPKWPKIQPDPSVRNEVIYSPNGRDDDQGSFGSDGHQRWKDRRRLESHGRELTNRFYSSEETTSSELESSYCSDDSVSPSEDDKSSSGGESGSEDDVSISSGLESGLEESSSGGDDSNFKPSNTEPCLTNEVKGSGKLISEIDFLNGSNDAVSQSTTSADFLDDFASLQMGTGTSTGGADVG